MSSEMVTDTEANGITDDNICIFKNRKKIKI